MTVCLIELRPLCFAPNDFYFTTAPFKRQGSPTRIYGTSGWFEFSGQATFYEGLTLKDLAKFGFTVGAKTGAGLLPSLPATTDNTKTIANLKTFLANYQGPTSKTVPHLLEVSWDDTQNKTIDFGRTRVTSIIPDEGSD
jgi:hypothetical protein